MRIAIAVGRFQPLHYGHCGLINKMIMDNEIAIVGVGSAQLSKEERNPWSVNDRIQMIKNVYGDRIKLVPVQDLGSDITTDDWGLYILDKVKKLGLPDPNDPRNIYTYHSGSEADAAWYKGVFNDQYNLRLKILERSNTPYLSASEIRTLLQLRDPKWKNWVPAVNWDLIENGYPDKFYVK